MVNMRWNYAGKQTINYDPSIELFTFTVGEEVYTATRLAWFQSYEHLTDCRGNFCFE